MEKKHQCFDIVRYVTKSLQAELDEAQKLLIQSNVCQGTTAVEGESLSRTNANKIEQIKQLPQGESIWFIHSEIGTEYWRATCFLVYCQKRGREEQEIEHKLATTLSVECQLLPSNERSTDTMYDLILGAILSSSNTTGKDHTLERPAKVLFESETIRLQLQQTLRKMGISDAGIAGKELLASAASFQDVGHTVKKKALNLLLNMDPADPQPLGALVAASVESDRKSGEYVTEERKPMRKWKPPRNCKIPLSWFASPPPPNSSDNDAQELLGWRTNFRRAFSTVDIPKMKEIIAERPHKEVRMLCECLMLMNKACEKGLVDVVRLLLDHCGCHIEGIQNQGIPASWRPIRSALGDTESDFTPLLVAVYWGRAGVVRLLLERGASLTARDSARGMTALLWAAHRGHYDIVELLCQQANDADSMSSRNNLGQDALALADESRQQQRTAAQARPFRRTLAILRSYDTRCAGCGIAGAQFHCPCGMESYCCEECQRARWQLHKKKHKAAMRKLTERATAISCCEPCLRQREIGVI